jgi:wyosine [tRNA(Phe)-imidazoG37] synthetase (radical SAM superfamily)
MTLQNYLTTTDHNRNVSHLRYIYPVISRRAQGVSIGINLNINNACNWRCIYCQVPNLTRGIPPPIELDILQQELESLLTDVLHGDFMQRYVAEEDRHLQDIAFSGNGEPTSAKEFPQVLEIVEEVLRKFDLLGKIKIRLITNGSLIDRPAILESLKLLARCNGEVWFKVDAGTRTGIARINDVSLNPQSHVQRLKKCAHDGTPPDDEEIAAYLALLDQVSSVVQGVYLYGLARPSLQAEAERLSRLSLEWLEKMAQRIRQHGLTVHVSP